MRTPWLRWTLSLFLIAAVGAVALSPGGRSVFARDLDLESHGDRTSALGTWRVDLVLRESRLGLWRRNVARMSGVLTVSAPVGDSGPSGHAVAIELVADLAQMPGTYPDTLHGEGIVTRSGALWMTLGPCCDAGALEFTLRPSRGGYRGVWHQQRLDDQPRGLAKLQRSVQD